VTVGVAVVSILRGTASGLWTVVDLRAVIDDAPGDTTE
jgi:hypothetical protein